MLPFWPIMCHFYTQNASVICQRTYIVGVKTWIIKNIGTLILISAGIGALSTFKMLADLQNIFLHMICCPPSCSLSSLLFSSSCLPLLFLFACLFLSYSSFFFPPSHSPFSSPPPPVPFPPLPIISVSQTWWLWQGRWPTRWLQLWGSFMTRCQNHNGWFQWEGILVWVHYLGGGINPWAAEMGKLSFCGLYLTSCLH